MQYLMNSSSKIVKSFLYLLLFIFVSCISTCNLSLGQDLPKNKRLYIISDVPVLFPNVYLEGWGFPPPTQTNITEIGFRAILPDISPSTIEERRRPGRHPEILIMFYRPSSITDMKSNNLFAEQIMDNLLKDRETKINSPNSPIPKSLHEAWLDKIERGDLADNEFHDVSDLVSRAIHGSAPERDDRIRYVYRKSGRTIGYGHCLKMKAGTYPICDFKFHDLNDYFVIDVSVGIEAFDQLIAIRQAVKEKIIEFNQDALQYQSGLDLRRIQSIAQ